MGGAPSLEQSYTNALSSWYSGEEPNYNYNTGSGSGVIGHFTQVVWRSSTTVGCAVKFDCSNSSRPPVQTAALAS
jgi:hypothetical protein